MIQKISILYPDRIQNIHNISMDTHLRIQKWIRIRKSTDSCIHGYYLDTTWIQIGYKMDMYPRIYYGYTLDTTWIQIGYKMDMYPWIYYGYNVDTNWIQDGYVSMDILWIHFGYKVDTVWIYIHDKFWK